MRVYNNAKEINSDLKVLKLKRDISIEELKLVKEEFKEDLSVSNWVQSALKIFAKLGMYRLARKVF